MGRSSASSEAGRLSERRMLFLSESQNIQLFPSGYEPIGFVVELLSNLDYAFLH